MKKRVAKPEKSLEELQEEFNQRIADMYRPATPKEQIIGFFRGVFKIIFFFAIGYVIYLGIPGLILSIGIQLDKAFHVDDVFLFASFGVIFLYMLYMGVITIITKTGKKGPVKLTLNLICNSE